MAGDSAHRLAIHGFYIGKSGESETVFTDVFEDVFAPVPERPLLFECIGDSITCGESLEDPIDGKEWNPAWQGTRNHFAMILAQRRSGA